MIDRVRVNKRNMAFEIVQCPINLWFFLDTLGPLVFQFFPIKFKSLFSKCEISLLVNNSFHSDTSASLTWDQAEQFFRFPISKLIPNQPMMHSFLSRLLKIMAERLEIFTRKNFKICDLSISIWTEFSQLLYNAIVYLKNNHNLDKHGSCSESQISLNSYICNDQPCSFENKSQPLHFEKPITSTNFSCSQNVRKGDIKRRSNVVGLPRKSFSVNKTAFTGGSTVGNVPEIKDDGFAICLNDSQKDNICNKKIDLRLKEFERLQTAENIDWLFLGIICKHLQIISSEKHLQLEEIHQLFQ